MIHLSQAEVAPFITARSRGGEHLHVVMDDGEGDIYDPFVRALHLPSWTGHNLDALIDALRDVVDRHDAPWTLVWQPAPGRERTAGVQAVLADLEDEAPGLTVALADGAAGPRT